jgi:opacity protein-like surface antigen
MELKTVAAAALLAATASQALAADLDDLLPPAPVLEDAPETWYLRGHIGAVRPMRPEAGFTAAPLAGDLAREGIADAAVAGLGIGYRFGPMLRTDLTLDHRFEARFQGVATAPVFAGGTLHDRARIQSSTLMWNAYADLGTWNGLTPYLGAGLGLARTVVSHHVRVTEDNTGQSSSERLSGRSEYGFAWALMAGFGYEILPGLTVDLGYRFLSLGDVKTRSFGFGSGLALESLSAHEVRLGLRYMFE